MSLAITILRVLTGSLFIGHGTQKLFGWFGGPGLDGTAGFFESIGLRPGRRHARAAGLAEAGGGALLSVGALTPVATTMVSGTMVTAIRKVHAPKGPWAGDGGWEYNAVLLAAMAVLAEHGPGALSVDRTLLPRFHGKGWALASIAAGVAGSFLVDQFSEPAPVPRPGSTQGATS